MRIGWICLAALLAACDASDGKGSGAWAASTEPIRFRFAPPDGIEFVENVFHRMHRHCEALPSALFETEGKLAVKIRRSESGYVMTTKHLSVRSRYNGDGYNDPFLARLVGMDLTHRIDAGGRLLTVDGMSDVARLRATYRTDSGPTFATTAEEVFHSLESQWNRRIAVLAGTSVAFGETVETTLSFPLPGRRSLTIPQKISVLRPTPCPAPRCALVVLDSQSNDAALAEFVAEMVRDVMVTRYRAKRDELPKPIGSAITSSASLVIDPDTMLIYEDTGSQSSSWEMDVPGYGRASFEMIYEWRNTFDYPAASPAT